MGRDVTDYLAARALQMDLLTACSRSASSGHDLDVPAYPMPGATVQKRTDAC
jgi:hypothetical protein